MQRGIESIYLFGKPVRDETMILVKEKKRKEKNLAYVRQKENRCISPLIHSFICTRP